MVEQRRRFPSDPRLISDMRDFIRNAVGEEWNEADDHQVISQLELAVSEAASNILLHGLQGHPGESIELILEVADDRAFVTFLYQGCAFTPPAVPTPERCNSRAPIVCSWRIACG